MQNKNIENEQSTKTPELNVSKKRKIIASILLGMGIVVGGHTVANKVNDEQRFPDGYQNIPKPEIIMEAPNSVIPGVQIEQEPVAELKTPYVEAPHSVIPPGNTEQTPEK